MSAPYPQEKGVAKGGKGGQPHVEPWSSEVYFSGGGKGGHGGAGAMWRQNMKSLRDFLYPSTDMGVFLSNLSNFAQSYWGYERGEWDTRRAYLEKVRNNVAQGLVWAWWAG